jgi:hypothetical protein
VLSSDFVILDAIYYEFFFLIETGWLNSATKKPESLRYDIIRFVINSRTGEAGVNSISRTTLHQRALTSSENLAFGRLTIVKPPEKLASVRANLEIVCYLRTFDAEKCLEVTREGGESTMVSKNMPNDNKDGGSRVHGLGLKHVYDEMNESVSTSVLIFKQMSISIPKKTENHRIDRQSLPQPIWIHADADMPYGVLF